MKVKQANDYILRISQELGRCITTSAEVGKKYIGKVRDTYDQGNQLLIVTTDRLSAFDRVLTAIPFKGQVLNQISAWWFKETAHIIPNHLIDVPKPNVMLVKKCQVYPIEFIVRAYITGTTDTSIWAHYAKGEREYCGHHLPDGLVKNQRLPELLITPTTKDAEHDQLLSADDILKRHLVTKDEWQYLSRVALQLFNFASQKVAERGLILVDTKYEFGKDRDGNILLVDEIFTPDSSRYWLAKTYPERLAKNTEPDNFDKEMLRLWYKQQCNPYTDKILPKAPDELRIKLAERYIDLYEMITGQVFFQVE